MTRKDSDEFYVLDLCDRALGAVGSRQHRFDWLLGDESRKTGRRTSLPVDAYWRELRLVVEFRERQHDEPVGIFDKPDRLTLSGVNRGEQREIYDKRRESEIPAHGIRLVVITTRDFAMRSHRILRRPDDINTVRRLLDLAALDLSDSADRSF